MVADMPPDPFTDEETTQAVNIAMLELFATEERAIAPGAAPASPIAPSGALTPDTIRRALEQMWGAFPRYPTPRFFLFVAVGTSAVWRARVTGAGLDAYYEIRESPFVSPDAGVVVDRWLP